MALSKTTRNHDEIREWAEARGAKPAEVASTETGAGAGILRLEFPKAPNKNDSNLKEISWEEFFEKFDASDLELVLQDLTADGEQSNFNRFIHPEHEEHSSRSGKKAPAKAAAKKTAKKAAHQSDGAKTAGKKASAKKTSSKKASTKKAPAKKSVARKAPSR